MIEKTTFSMRIDKPLKLEIARAAVADRRSLASMIAKILDDFLAANGNANRHQQQMEKVG